MEILERWWCARWLDVQICDWIDGTLPATAVCTSRRPSMEHMQAIILYCLPAYRRNFPCLAPSIFIPKLRARLSPTMKPDLLAGLTQHTPTLVVESWQTCF